jgi:hypothetical protein
VVAEDPGQKDFRTLVSQSMDGDTWIIKQQQNPIENIVGTLQESNGVEQDGSGTPLPGSRDNLYFMRVNDENNLDIIFRRVYGNRLV